MRYQVRCVRCGATGWVRGSVEHDTNTWTVRDGDVDDICEHLANGDEYEGTGKVEYEED